MTLVVDEHPSPRDRVEANEDWDRSVLVLPAEANGETGATSTPQTVPHVNGSDAHAHQEQQQRRVIVAKRSIAELLSLHAANESEVQFSAEEANRVEEVLRQWINSESSPYEGEDNFFYTLSQNDPSLYPSRTPSSGGSLDSLDRRRENRVSSQPPSLTEIQS